MFDEITRIGFGNGRRAQTIVDNLLELELFKKQNFEFIPTLPASRITKHMIHIIIDELRKQTKTNVKLVTIDEFKMQIKNDQTVFFEIYTLKNARFGEYFRYKFDKRFDEQKLRKAVDSLIKKSKEVV